MIQFSFSEVKSCLFCIRFQMSRFSFASALIERVIKDIYGTLMYICVKRNIGLNICGWQIYWLFCIDVIIKSFFLIHSSLQLSLRGSVM